jgi:threonine/homoserine/homoserine lactone efflux protein
MNSTEMTALLLLYTAASFTPGPNTTQSIALATNFGLKRTLRFVPST